MRVGALVFGFLGKPEDPALPVVEFRMASGVGASENHHRASSGQLRQLRTQAYLLFGFFQYLNFGSEPFRDGRLYFIRRSSAIQGIEGLAVIAQRYMAAGRLFTPLVRRHEFQQSARGTRPPAHPQS
ncbi:MAG: hypothetical protein WA369_05470 [Candidatus Acidiferrales bacterium]